MNRQEKSSILDKAKEILSVFESGDLMAVLELKETYLTIQAELYADPSFREIAKFVSQLARTVMKLSQTGHENEIIGLMDTANGILEKVLTEEIAPENAAVLIDKISPAIEEILRREKRKDGAVREKPAVSGTDAPPVIPDDISLEEHYGPAYFSAIVDDKKMLSQLADEIKEHMDIAQFTLVELEYDETNHENINKVFRAFHTVKGSSAFLGLRNFEEIGHEMENLLVLIRDGKFRISRDLIDVIFYGIDLLRNLVSIMETLDFNIEKMRESFYKVDIFSYIDLIKRILSQYKTKKIGEILAEEGKLTKEDILSILQKQSETDDKFGTIAIREKMVSADDVKDAIRKQTSVAKKVSYVKVSNERLNTLIDIVGELVINQSMLRQVIDLELKQSRQASSKDDNGTSVEKIISQLEGITTNIKNIVLSMGMVPITEVFNKLRVVIRNTSNELHKTVIVDIHGEDTELDRNVVEAIYDPLVHMVRNAVDHGVESPDERVKAGKDRVGRVSVSAEHRGNGIQIIVEDDGAGIDKDAIIRKGVERGLITAEDAQEMTDKEIYNLLFLPGFSTAKKVTEVSGRGVGMDVVKKNIDEIHGKVEIASELGKYTRFIIRLPLTLAIIEGFVIQIGENNYVLPFNAVDEILVPQPDQIRDMEDGSRMLFNRGNYIPLIFSNAIFTHEIDISDKNKQLLAVIISHENKNYGILVDKIIGKQEIVIKNLGESLSQMSVFSGGTIFGDGAIGFVVDIEGFLDAVKNREEKTSRKLHKAVKTEIEMGINQE
jgi:two-component system chemotaxis sensor kinase CheA